MLAREIERTCEYSSYKRLVDYLVNPMGTQERVGQVTLSNCVSTSVRDAVMEVLNTQALNERVAEKTSHLLVSFQQGDEPSPELLQIIETRLCQALGLDEHQRISVVHHDTDNLHMHIAVNRIHPTSLNGHWPRWSRYVLAYASETLERELGTLQETDWHLKRDEMGKAKSALKVYLNNAFVHDALNCGSWAALHALASTHGVALQPRGQGLELRHSNGARVPASAISRALTLGQLQKRLGEFLPAELALSRKATASHGSPQRVQRPTTQVAPIHSEEARPPLQMEHLADTESFCGWLQRHHASHMQEAGSWDALHTLGAEHGFAVRLRNNGLVFESDAGVVVKGSSVHRLLSKGQLEKRLGPYKAPLQSSGAPSAAAKQPPSTRQTTAKPSPRYVAQVQSGSAELFARYQRDQAHRKEYKQELLKALRSEQSAAFKQWKDRARLRRRAILGTANSRVVRAIWHSYANRVAAQERAQLKTQFNTERTAIQQQHPQEGWLEWLRRQAAQGDLEALNALRKRASRARRSQGPQQQNHSLLNQPKQRNHGTPVGSPDTGAVHGPDKQWSDHMQDGTGSRRLRDFFLAAQSEQRRLAFAAKASLDREEIAAQNQLRTRSARRRSALRGLLIVPATRQILEPYLQRADEQELQRHLQDFLRRRRQLLATPELKWKHWLKQQAVDGNPEALAASPTPFAEVDHVTSEGTIVYSVPGAQVRDDGQRLSLSSSGNPVAVEAFLHLAHAKLGTHLQVDGNQAFGIRLAQVAAKAGIPIVFAAPVLEQVRESNRHQSRKDPNHESTRRRNPPNTSDNGGPTVHGRYGELAAKTPASYQPYPDYPTNRRSSSPYDGLSGMPTRDVVCHQNQPSLLLQNHAWSDVQRPKPEIDDRDHPLRRDTAEPPVAGQQNATSQNPHSKAVRRKPTATTPNVEAPQPALFSSAGDKSASPTRPPLTQPPAPAPRSNRPARVDASPPQAVKPPRPLQNSNRKRGRRL